MEFPFEVNSIFKEPITKISNDLLPPDFRGDRRMAGDVTSKVAHIITTVGEASAIAQGLSKPITTGPKARDQDHTIYVLTDPDGNHGKGVVTGLLKIGKKNLYVFDESGAHHQRQPTCVLDFYVHESRQRAGLGKQLFEHMLQDQKISPSHLAIDRPSTKFLNFLKKHYNLNDIVPQSNNFVVYNDFFKSPSTPTGANGRPYTREDLSPVIKHARANGLQSSQELACQIQANGRYGAYRQPCTMGELIQNMPAQPTPPRETNGNYNNRSPSVTSASAFPSSNGKFSVQDLAPFATECNTPKLERPSTLSIKPETTPTPPNISRTASQHSVNQDNGRPLSRTPSAHSMHSQIKENQRTANSARSEKELDDIIENGAGYKYVEESNGHCDNDRGDNDGNIYESSDTAPACIEHATIAAPANPRYSHTRLW